MLYFEATKDDVCFLDELKETYPDNIVTAKGRNFSGSTELIDVIIVLTPAILSSVAIIMNNILQHRISKIETAKNQPSEISFKHKNDKDEFELILKSSTISNKDELADAIEHAIMKIKELQGYE